SIRWPPSPNAWTTPAPPIGTTARTTSGLTTPATAPPPTTGDRRRTTEAVAWTTGAVASTTAAGSATAAAASTTDRWCRRSWPPCATTAGSGLSAERHLQRGRRAAGHGGHHQAVAFGPPLADVAAD